MDDCFGKKWKQIRECERCAVRSSCSTIWHKRQRELKEKESSRQIRRFLRRLESPSKTHRNKQK